MGSIHWTWEFQHPVTGQTLGKRSVINALMGKSNGKGADMKKTLLAVCVLVSGSALAEMPGDHFVENWDLDADGKVTVDEAAERRSDVFAAFDSNEDGVLDAEEYVLFDEARATDQAGRPGRHRPAQGLTLEANDLDGNGNVSLDEFVGRADAWISEIDRNGDGIITVADFGPR